jgi:1D-myo-inositol 3-kinase
MGPPPLKDILVVGNYCHDLLRPGTKQETHALGGSAAYISSVLDAMAVDYLVTAVVGEDFRYVGQVRYPPRMVAGTRTTQFTAEFHGDARVLRVGERGAPILPDYINVDARVALACGVMGEVLPETLERMSYRAERVMADAQGLLRALDGEGRVVNLRLEETPFAALLERLHVLKASEEEALALDVEAVRQRTCLVITRGRAGCTVLTAEKRVDVPAFTVEEVDPTGAGDCFLAGFALGLLRGMPLERCAALANWFGAQAVRQVGVPKLDVSRLPAELR